LEEVDIAGAHMMGFSAAVLPDLVAFLESMTPEADGIRQPIDGAYVSFRRAHPAVATRFAVPPLGRQRPSRTDIATPNWIDRAPVIRHFAGLARRVKRMLQPTFRQ
jgi:glycosyl transferase family 25